MLTLPKRLPDGSYVWLDPETVDFAQRLSELDPRLALVRNADTSWSIWRLAEDGSEVCVARSRPGALLDPEIITKLRENDTQARGYTDLAARLEKHNAQVEQDRIADDEELLLESVDRVLSKSWRGRVPVTDVGIEAAL